MKPQNQKLKLVFLGSGQYVLSILEVLNKNFNVAIVLTTEHNKDEPVSNFCKKNNISFVPIHRFNNETISTIKQSDAKIGILAYFGLILPKEILNVFPKGIINVHPSLLPKYRGASPGQSAILNNEKVTGVSIIKLDEEVDHGPILTQVEEPIYENDTAESLYKRLFKIGAGLIEDVLKKYLEGKIKLEKQNHLRATFTKPFSKVDGYFDISKPPVPEVLNRMIRAYYPWPGVFFKTQINENQKIIKLLPEKKIQVEGKKPMTYKDFINGYKEGEEILKKINLKLGISDLGFI